MNKQTDTSDSRIQYIYKIKISLLSSAFCWFIYICVVLWLYDLDWRVRNRMTHIARRQGKQSDREEDERWHAINYFGCFPYNTIVVNTSNRFNLCTWFFCDWLLLFVVVVQICRICNVIFEPQNIHNLLLMMVTRRGFWTSNWSQIRVYMYIWCYSVEIIRKWVSYIIYYIIWNNKYF